MTSANSSAQAFGQDLACCTHAAEVTASHRDVDEQRHASR
jgi:hypothetical protein